MGGAASQNENELVLDVLNIAEPAFAVNGERQIVAWNDAAERLLGLKAEEMIGVHCFDALAVQEGAMCAKCGLCPAGAFYPRNQQRDGMALLAMEQIERQVSMTTITAHTAGGQARIVHLLREGPANPGASGIRPLAANPSASGSRRSRPLMLTQRELEVLRLLGVGHSTDEIAGELNITRVTARNHVNKVLDKLGASSRLQAVVIASQLRLI